MNANEFRQYGSQMVDLVANYWETLRKRTPLPDVNPGFMRQRVPSDPPMIGEPWEQIFNDIDKVVIEGNTNWHHPNFYAYFPTACSYPSIMGDILSGGLASIGFSWIPHGHGCWLNGYRTRVGLISTIPSSGHCGKIGKTVFFNPLILVPARNLRINEKSSPSMTELELCMTDWLAKALGLPAEFLNSETGSGIGMIQNTASDATYVAILAARGRAIERIKAEAKKEKVDNERKEKAIPNGDEIDIGELCEYPYHDPAIMTKLVAYSSDQAHSSVEKGVMLAAVRLRKLKTVRGGPHDNFYVQSTVLQAAIEIDRKNGLVPFIFIMTLGTTSTCGVDPVDELGPICQKENIWIHVDSAYAGAFLICPEYRYLSRGFEYLDSFNMNTHKALQVNFDCSPMWFRNGRQAVKYFEVNPVYLKHNQITTIDYRHLQIALGRRFRSLKVWFVLRNIGITGLQKHLRKMVELAEYFETLIRNDNLLELYVPRMWGLVCFRLKDSTNEMNEILSRKINEDRRIHLVASDAHGVYFLRFVICSPLTTREDIIQAHLIIHKFAEDVLKSMKR